MRIVLLLDWFLYYTVELANALSKENEVLLISRDHSREISDNGDLSLDEFLSAVLQKRVRAEQLRYRRGNWRSLGEVLRLQGMIRRFNPHVIHVQDTEDWRIVLLAVLMRLRGRQVVLTVHDVVSHPGERRGVQRFLRKLLLMASCKIIVHGEYLRRQFVSVFPGLARRRTVAAVPLGVLSLYRKWDDESVKEDGMTVLFFGRISKYKGISTLVQAHRLVLKEIPQAELVIAGAGDELSQYLPGPADQEAHVKILNRFISTRQVPGCFRRASIVVLPYIEASQSAVVATAYAFAKPVVVTEVGSLPEIVRSGQTGLVVPPNNPEALAGAIVLLLKDKELRRRMSDCISSMASAELSWESIARETERVYCENSLR